MWFFTIYTLWGRHTLTFTDEHRLAEAYVRFGAMGDHAYISDIYRVIPVSPNLRMRYSQNDPTGPWMGVVA